MDFLTDDNFLLIITLVVPGYITYITTTYFTNHDKNKENLVFKLLFLGTLNLLIFNFFYKMIWELKESDILQFYTCFLLILVLGALFIGFIWSVIIKFSLFKRFLRRIGFHVSIGKSVVWDEYFSKIDKCLLVEIYLTDNTLLRGEINEKTMISEEEKERDLYIDVLYDIDASGKWVANEKTGAYIAKNQIKYMKIKDKEIEKEPKMEKKTKKPILSECKYNQKSSNQSIQVEQQESKMIRPDVSYCENGVRYIDGILPKNREVYSPIINVSEKKPKEKK